MCKCTTLPFDGDIFAHRFLTCFFVAALKTWEIMKEGGRGRTIEDTSDSSGKVELKGNFILVQQTEIHAYFFITCIFHELLWMSLVYMDLKIFCTTINILNSIFYKLFEVTSYNQFTKVLSLLYRLLIEFGNFNSYGCCKA